MQRAAVDRAAQAGQRGISLLARPHAAAERPVDGQAMRLNDSWLPTVERASLQEVCVGRMIRAIVM